MGCSGLTSGPTQEQPKSSAARRTITVQVTECGEAGAELIAVTERVACQPAVAAGDLALPDHAAGRAQEEDVHGAAVRAPVVVLRGRHRDVDLRTIAHRPKLPLS